MQTVSKRRVALISFLMSFALIEKNKAAKRLDLYKLGAPRFNDPLIRTIKESYVLTTFKQMSARISLRNIDDNGVAQRAHVCSIDGDLSLLIS